MKNMLTNWKTTSAGVMMILTAILSFLGVKVPGMTVDPSTAGPLLIAGLGLLFSKDGNVTGGTTPQ
jgi:hypothetical protein